LSHCSLLQNPWPKPTGVLEHCHDGETTFGFPLFGAFPSDCTPTATKEVNLYCFIDSFTFRNELVQANSCKLYNRIPGISQSYFCNSMLQSIHRKLENCSRFGVFTEVMTKIQFLWDVTPYRPVNSCRRFERS
jgi:hypothetical protein